jgi:hypothetical protein
MQTIAQVRFSSIEHERRVRRFQVESIRLDGRNSQQHPYGAYRQQNCE